MKILKRIFIVLLIIVAVAAVVGMFLPRKVETTQSIVINAPAEKIFPLLNDFEKWHLWTSWHEMDTATQYTWGDIRSGVGASYQWKSEIMSYGTVKIVESKPNEMLKTEVNFEDHGASYGTFTLTPEGSGTRVDWKFENDMGGNPFGHLFGPVMKSMIEKDYVKGLAKLKKIVEEMPTESASAMKGEVKGISESDFKEVYVLAIHDTASPATIGSKFMTYYPMLFEEAAAQNLKVTGPAGAIYYNDSQTNFEFDAYMPVEKEGKSNGSMKPMKIAGFHAAKANYYGPYEAMAPAYEGLFDFIKSINKKRSGKTIEVYVGDPVVEKDMMKVLTEVYMPIE